MSFYLDLKIIIIIIVVIVTIIIVNNSRVLYWNFNFLAIGQFWL